MEKRDNTQHCVQVHSHGGLECGLEYRFTKTHFDTYFTSLLCVSWFLSVDIVSSAQNSLNQCACVPVVYCISEVLANIIYFEEVHIIIHFLYFLYQRFMKHSYLHLQKIVD